MDLPKDKPELLSCEICHAGVTELRRGRCWGCYSRWVETRPVGAGAACIVCSERRRDNLRQVELLRAWVPMCHNCASKATQMSPMPGSLEEIRRRLSRDRRARDRRIGKTDTRVFPRDRRGLERRAVGHASAEGDLMLVDDDLLIEISEDDLVELEPGEETRIVQRIQL
jgi:hypothetical protein